jgi:uncharacterized membrane protein YcaP (DUF421 family)
MTWADILAWGSAITILVGSDEGPITWWQMTIRGLFLFLYGVLLVRVAGPRLFGGAAVLDLMLAVIIGSNLSRALTATAPLFPTVAATAAIVFAHWLLARLAVRYEFISWLVKGRRVRLVRCGTIDWTAMRRHAIGRGDLLDAAREAGILDVEQIEDAYLQRNGKILVTRGG